MILLTLEPTRCCSPSSSFSYATISRDSIREFAVNRFERCQFDANTSARACAAIDRACACTSNRCNASSDPQPPCASCGSLGTPQNSSSGPSRYPFGPTPGSKSKESIVNDKASATETYAVLDRC